MSIAKAYTKIDRRTTDNDLGLLTLDLIAIAHTEQFTVARKLIMQRLQALLAAQATADEG